MLLGPFALLLMALGHDLAQLLTTIAIELLYLGEDDERILGIATQVLDRVGESVATKGCTMGLDVVLVAGPVGLERAFGHDRMANDEDRALLLLLGHGKGLANLVGIIAVDLDDAPSPSLILHSHVLGIDDVALGRELDLVGVVEHDEVVQAQRTGNAAHALADLLLHSTIADVGIYLVLHGRMAEASLKKLLCHGRTSRKGMSLSQRSGRVLHSVLDVALGVSRSDAAPLAELLDVFNGKFSLKGQGRIEHRRHVTRVKEEAVSTGPCGLIRVVNQKFGEQNIDKIGTAHRTSRVSGLRLLYHRGSQDADVVGCAIH